MRHWENIWSFKTAQFRVDFDVTEDDDLDLSWDDDGSTRASLESGNCVAFVARVAVYHNGRLVSGDMLGGCIYKNVQEFVTAHRDPDPMNRNCSYMRSVRGECVVICHYFPDMVRTAIANARE